MKRPTTGSDGRWNGYLVEIWNGLDRPDLQPSQVYLTAVAPHSRKGPHLHMRRRGLFFCAVGTVFIRTRNDAGVYSNKILIANADPLVIAPGTPCAIYNDWDELAVLLNLPAPAWSKDNPDDCPVADWQDPMGWIV